MLLSDRSIRNAVQAGEIEITPWDPSLVQPASVDLRLGSTFLRFEPHQAGIVDLDGTSKAHLMTRHEVPEGESFVLMPGELALGETLETVKIYATHAGRLEGKSSLARLGIMAHATAGWVDPGWNGVLTLELMNAGPFPVRLKPGMRAAQICFFVLTSMAVRPYGHHDLGSHYQRQEGVMASQA